MSAVCQLYLAWADGEVHAGRMAASNYLGHATHLLKFARFAPDGEATPFGERRARDLIADDLGAFAGAMQDAGHKLHYAFEARCSVDSGVVVRRASLVQ